MTDPWSYVHVADEVGGKVGRSFPWLADDIRSEARAWLPAAVAAIPAGVDPDGLLLRRILRRRCLDYARSETMTRTPVDKVGAPWSAAGQGEQGPRQFRLRGDVSLTAPPWWHGDPGDYLTPSTLSHEDAVVERAWCAYVLARVALLPDRQREALLAELGTAEALAAAWGVSRSRVSQVRSQARAALAGLLEEEAA